MAATLILVRYVALDNFRALAQSPASTKSNLLLYLATAACWIWYGSSLATTLGSKELSAFNFSMIWDVAPILVSFSCVPLFARDLSPVLLDRMYLPVSRSSLFVIRTLTLYCSPIGLTVSIPAVILCVMLIGELASPLFLWSSFCGIIFSHFVAMLIIDLVAIMGATLSTVLVAASVAAIFIASSLAVSDMLSDAWGQIGVEGILSSTHVVGCLTLAMAGAILGSFVLHNIRFSAARNRDSMFRIHVPSSQDMVGVIILVLNGIRSFGRILDPYIGVALSIMYTSFLVTTDAPNPDASLVIIMIVLLSNVGIAMNLFGMESGQSLDRYSLIPINRRQLLISKHASYCAICSIQLLPVLGAIALEFGLQQVILLTLSMITIVLGYLGLGTWMSIRVPFPMNEYQLSYGGSLVHLLIIISASNLPVALGVRINNLSIIAAIFAVYLTLYCLSVWRFDNHFEESMERIRDSVS